MRLSLRIWLYLAGLGGLVAAMYFFSVREGLLPSGSDPDSPRIRPASNYSYSRPSSLGPHWDSGVFRGNPDYENRDGRTPQPQFSHPHGYYDQPFELTVDSAHPETEIWYTTDGSIPLSPEEQGGPNGRRFTGKIPVNQTLYLSAVAQEPNLAPSVPVTCTWLFLDDILKQDRDLAVAVGWPRHPVNAKQMDYGMDPRIVEQFTRQEWKEAFTQIDTMSLVLPLDFLIHPEYGIYVNPQGHGKPWERFVSVELLDRNGGPGFQVGAGLRIRGGFTRNSFFVKHAFRLFFRKIYGAGKLKYALFEDEGAARFDKIDLRTAQNYSWARRGDRPYGTHNTFVRDVFCRDTQRDMGFPYTRSRYYHLFLNGQYWGIYMTEERPEAAYGATYFGGEREDYDTLKSSNMSGGYVLEATDGNVAAWRTVWELSRKLAQTPHEGDRFYAELTGLTPDLSGPSGKPALVDVDNLINFMLNHFYAGNSDAPLSRFMGNSRANNWFAIRNRHGWEGFRFFVHDAEHTLGTPDSMNDRTGPYFHRHQNLFPFSNPQWLHQDLTNHPRYRRRFQEIAKEHLTGGGALTTERSVARFLFRARQIDKAIRAQSARWGDAAPRTSRPYTVQDWESRIRWVVDTVLPDRELMIIEQLKQDGLYE